MTVAIYTTPTCKFCKMTKEFFKAHNVQYTEYNVVEDKTKAAEAIEKSGQMGVPVVDIDGTIIVGFDEKALRTALKIKG